jgi:hypothetical protein
MNNQFDIFTQIIKIVKKKLRSDIFIKLFFIMNWYNCHYHKYIITYIDLKVIKVILIKW